MSTWAIVLAAGEATRFGGRKQFANAGGVRLVDRVVQTASSTCDSVVVVLPEGALWNGPPVAAVVVGGPTRAGSVRSALRTVGPDADVIVVHDAAHPLAPPELFASVIDAVRQGADAAIPALPVTDPIKRVRDDMVVETLPRRDLVLVQTPHAFRADVLRAVHATDGEAIEDSAMVEEAGGTIAVVRGDPANVHVITKADLEFVARLLGGA
jgi:2-C-methyl-D-erythritol 4-phosphate cytidylyltransferase